MHCPKFESSWWLFLKVSRSPPRLITCHPSTVSVKRVVSYPLVKVLNINRSDYQVCFKMKVVFAVLAALSKERVECRNQNFQYQLFFSLWLIKLFAFSFIQRRGVLWLVTFWQLHLKLPFQFLNYSIEHDKCLNW